LRNTGFEFGFGEATEGAKFHFRNFVSALLSATSAMKPLNFFAELKRRNVYKVAVAYAVVGWLVIQISSTVLPTFHAPEWVVQTLIVLIVLGFPIALVIAWAFEMTAR
jgi:hypothetical protein